MRSFICLLALCISVSMLRAQDQAKFSPAQQEVLKVRDALRETALRRDMAAWSRHVADDCIFTTDDGELQTKAQLIEHVGKLPRDYDHSANPRDYVIHVYGDTAVVNFRITGYEQYADSDIVTETRQTETYVKQNGSWLLVARQWGMLPVNFRKPFAVETSVYKDYVGQYEWHRGDDLDVVSVKDGKLWSQFGKDEDEYLPLGAETFFVRTDLGSITFVRDARGHVVGYTYLRSDGQKIHVKKIK
jgi:ketosteroid isomerase-like protein